ncbi:tetratricopeptide repeat protein [bacterium]|nr:tetratricopeptide repeat protein [bacterium]
MGKVEIRCDECGHEARVPETFRGRRVRCLRCGTQLRVPEETPGKLATPSGAVVSAARPGTRKVGRKARGPSSRIARGAPPAKVRRTVQQSIREIVGDYEHAIETSPRGFEVDVRGIAFGLARTLVEDLLSSPFVRDVNLSGGTGECHMRITIEGAVYEPDDSFADEDDETEVFRRASNPNARSPLELTLDTSPRRRSSRMQKALPPPRAASLPAPAPAPSSDLARMVEKGWELLDKGDARAAIEALEPAVRLDRNDVGAVQALGQAYARAGDHERACFAWKHLSRLMPEDAEIAILHAASAVACDRLEDARLALTQAIKLDPAHPKAYRYAAVLYTRLGEPEKARKFRAKYESLKGADRR